MDITKALEEAQSKDKRYESYIKTYSEDEAIARREERIQYLRHDISQLQSQINDILKEPLKLNKKQYREVKEGDDGWDDAVTGAELFSQGIVADLGYLTENPWLSLLNEKQFPENLGEIQ